MKIKSVTPFMHANLSYADPAYEALEYIPRITD